MFTYRSLFGRHRRLGILGFVAFVSVALSSCSAGTSAGSTSNTAGLEGDPIRTVTIAAVDYNGPTYENILVTARAFEHHVNNSGGINGRPLEVTVCDDKGDPTQAAACARDAISAGAIADVGSFSYNAAATVPIYDAAQTAVFGNCCNLSQVEYSSANTFQLGSNPALNPSSVGRAVQDGCKAIGVLELEIPGVTDSMNELMENVAKSYGYKGELKFVRVPLTTSDYTSQVTQVTDGTDCIALFLSESNISAMMPSFGQTGGEQTLYGAQGNLNKVSTGGYESLPGVKNAVVTATYLPLQEPVWEDYREALTDINAPTNFDYSSLGSLGTWAAYTGFVQILKSMPEDDITPSSFAAAASKAKVDTGGMLPAVDFSKTWGAFDGQYQRSFNRNVTFVTIAGKILVEGNNPWIDYSSPLEGKPQS